jgi:hypothetical protein
MPQLRAGWWNTNLFDHAPNLQMLLGLAIVVTVAVVRALVTIVFVVQAVVGAGAFVGASAHEFAGAAATARWISHHERHKRRVGGRQRSHSVVRRLPP